MPAPCAGMVMIGFMMQLYLDFSAYTDIAIGSWQTDGRKTGREF
jgi:D-alanyl-lipoteichoic acid acyltransferase DltB (MBOAT superfamily)